MKRIILPLLLFALALSACSAQATPTPAAQATCPNCAKNVQTAWQNCPYCGVSLK